MVSWSEVERTEPGFARAVTASADPPEDDPSSWSGDAKVSGRAVRTGPLAEAPEGAGFRADIAEVVRTRVEGDELVVELWRPGRPLHQVRRK
jgi:hypothetical protein